MKPGDRTHVTKVTVAMLHQPVYLHVRRGVETVVRLLDGTVRFSDQNDRIIGLHFSSPQL